jgi:hypothetical protein
LFTEPEDPAPELRVPPLRDLPVCALADQPAQHGQQQQWGHTPDTLSKEISTHCNENPIYVFPEKELRGLNPDFTFMCLWMIYVSTGSVHIFSCSRIGRPMVGIYKSLTDTGMWKLGLRGHAIPFLGIFVSNFFCFVFAMQIDRIKIDRAADI